ncbi:MAG: hypothetical protein ABR867_01500, partial [Nitrososphaerales archaeon]
GMRGSIFLIVGIRFQDRHECPRKIVHSPIWTGALFPSRILLQIWKIFSQARSSYSYLRSSRALKSGWEDTLST